MTETEVLTEKNLGGLEVTTVSESPEFINLLVYGNPGVGKTVLAGSADAVPELRPVLILDVEGGTFSIRERYPDVDVIRVQTWPDMQKVYDALYKGEHDYQTVVLDSLTEIQKFSMYRIMASVLQEHPDRDPEVPSIREWGKNIEQIRRLVRAFRDLPMNVVFTALAATDKDNKTGLVTTRPSLSGKLAMEVGGFVDILLYMYIKRVDDANQRLLLSAGTEGQIAKDRSDNLPPVIIDPTMQTLYDHIFKETVDES
jgi:phage nucleotide-binding protein